ncbi:hypothetical protein [Promicromonospora kroppenstedtii]|uniref:hypothetical protein n=1 Tax=Promicromonospora kroppenstedtii TaxID=440482 RepID=UPI0004BA7F53|nr:hypothetical protein [Promicromonospora kroppenstedtii]
MEETEIVGRLHYPGDVRNADPMLYDSPRHGLVRPVMAEYDETTDKTLVEFAAVGE